MPRLIRALLSVRKFSSLLAIFLPPWMFKNAPCIQTLKNFLPVAASDWAISLVWWMSTWSIPPQWMSSCSPRNCMLMAEHSMCHPGKPTPQGESHSIWRLAPAGENFHKAKSVALRFCGFFSTRAPS